MIDDVVHFRFRVYCDRTGLVHVDSETIGKYYPNELIMWNQKTGFELDAFYDDGKDAQRQKAGPTPELIARFKTDLERHAKCLITVEDFLGNHPELMGDTRTASLGEADRIRRAEIDAAWAKVLAPGPAKVHTGTDWAGKDWEYVAKRYAEYDMSWDPTVGFTIILPHSLIDCQAFETVPGPDQIARFKSDLRYEATINLKLAALLLKHPELMTDNRAISFAAAHETHHPEFTTNRLPLPRAFSTPAAKPGATPGPQKLTRGS